MEEQALDHYRNGEFAEAERLYRQMLDDEPANPQVLFMLSLTRQRQHDLDQPVDLLGRALEVQPDNPSLHFALGGVHLERGELDRAERHMARAVEIDPNFAEAQNGLAWVALARHDWAAAEQALRQALKGEPGNHDARVKLGIALLEQGEVDGAIGQFQRVLAEETGHGAAQFQLGRAFMRQDNPGFAVRCFENALEAAPEAPETLRWLARAHAANGQHEDAGEAWRKLMQADGETVEGLVGLARARRLDGKAGQAEGLLLRALRLEPGATETLLELSRTLAALGRWREVASRLEPLAGDDAPEALGILLAEALLETGRQREALDAVRGLLSEGAPDPRARLLFARILFETGEDEAGDAQLERLLQAERPLPEAVLLRARRLLAAAELGEAEMLLRGLQKRHDVSARERALSLTLLGDVLHAGGRYQQAWETWIGLPERPAAVMRMAHERPHRLEDGEDPASAMAREVAWSWPPKGPDDGRGDPVFVFAWPGSGRERLLAALAAHGDIALVDDAVTAQASRRERIGWPRGATALGRLADADVRLARRNYWRETRRMAGEGAPLVIDALWLSVESLPTVYRLFPRAQVIVLRRDPRDMAVEWLRRGYAARDEMAAVYGSQLDLLQRCEEGVPLGWISLEHDELVEDPEGGLRDLAARLQLSPDGAMLEAWQEQPPAVIGPGAGEHYAPWLERIIAALEGGEMQDENVLW